LDGPGEQSADAVFVSKFDLLFRGVDVDVDLAWVDFEEETADREATLHEGGVVAFDEGEIEAAIFDGATVYEEILIFASGARDAGGSDESPDAQVGLVVGGGSLFAQGVEFAAGAEIAGKIDGNEGEILAEEGAEPFTEGFELRGA